MYFARVWAILTAMSPVFLTGCGHFMHRLEIGNQPIASAPPFGGVRFDVDEFKYRSQPSTPASMLHVTLAAIDVPFSAVADTLLLPQWAISHAKMIRQNGGAEPPAESKFKPAIVDHSDDSPNSLPQDEDWTNM